MGGQGGNSYEQVALDTFLSQPLSCPHIELVIRGQSTMHSGST